MNWTAFHHRQDPRAVEPVREVTAAARAAYRPTQQPPDPVSSDLLTGSADFVARVKAYLAA